VKDHWAKPFLFETPPFCREFLHRNLTYRDESRSTNETDPSEGADRIDRYGWDGSDPSLSIRRRSLALRRAGSVESMKSTRAQMNCSGASI
jgi:hypothetical protein